jgi:hypothetical protein
MTTTDPAYARRMLILVVVRVGVGVGVGVVRQPAPAGRENRRSVWAVSTRS